MKSRGTGTVAVLQPSWCEANIDDANETREIFIKTARCTSTLLFYYYNSSPPLRLRWVYLFVRAFLPSPNVQQLLYIFNPDNYASRRQIITSQIIRPDMSNVCVHTQRYIGKRMEGVKANSFNPWLLEPVMSEVSPKQVKGHYINNGKDLGKQVAFLAFSRPSCAPAWTRPSSDGRQKENQIRTRQSSQLYTPVTLTQLSSSASVSTISPSLLHLLSSPETYKIPTGSYSNLY